MDALAPHRFTTPRSVSHTGQVDDGTRKSPTSTQAGSCSPVPSARGPTQNRLRQKETKMALRSEKFINSGTNEV